MRQWEKGIVKKAKWFFNGKGHKLGRALKAYYRQLYTHGAKKKPILSQ